MKFRRVIAIIAALMLVIGLLPAAVSGEGENRIIIPGSMSVDKGDSCVISVTFEPAGYSEAVTWASDNEKIATVNKNGKVKALKAGQCVITAETGSGLTAQCAVTVTRPVKSVALNRYSAELGLNRTMQLTATVKPDKADDKTIEWTTSDPAVAVVDENGLVSAVGRGKCVITARANNGKRLSAASL